MSPSQSSSRKNHTKSRRGCSACKQRHQKCDETRPSCVNCRTAHRHCPYLDDIPNEGVATRTKATSRLPTKRSLRGGEATEHTPPPPLELLLRTPSSTFIHIDLLQYWLTQTYKAVVGPRSRADTFSPIVLNHALTSPFLMQALLAVAALHKSVTTHQAKYVATATQLQAEGLANFNILMANLDEKTIIPGFLFTFVTGVHRLAQALLEPNPHRNLLVGLIDAMMFLRGVNTIISGWWPYLRSSELSVLFAPSESSNEVDTPQQTEQAVSRLRDLIDVVRMGRGEVSVYETVIESLQNAYSSLNGGDAVEDDHSLGFVVVWMITMPVEFIEYLREERPEALIVLAHCGPSLHSRRSSWAVGGAGKALVDVVSARLAEEWQSWLQWPRRVVNAT